LESASTCKLKIGGCGVLDKKIEVKFGTAIRYSEGLLDCIDVEVWGPTKIASVGGHQYFVSFVDDLSRRCYVYPMRRRIEVLYMLVK